MSSPDALWHWRTDRHPDRSVVSLSGELDLTVVNQLRDLLTTAIAASRTVDVDLARLTFLDSTILSVLVAAHQAARLAGGTLTLLNATGQVRRVLVVTGILPILGPGHASNSPRPDDA